MNKTYDEIMEKMKSMDFDEEEVIIEGSHIDEPYELEDIQQLNESISYVKKLSSYQNNVHYPYICK